MNPLLQQAWQEGERTWPTIHLPIGQFAMAAERRGWDLSSKHVSDLYYSRALELLDRQALHHFHTHRVPTIRSHLRRFALDSDARNETIQGLCVKLLFDVPPKVASYAGEGRLDAWLKVVATRMVLDRLGRRLPFESLDDDLAAVSAAPELLLMRQELRDSVTGALRTIVNGLDPFEKTILRLTFREGLSTAMLATVLSISKSTAARRVASLRATIRRELERRLGGGRELDSVLRALGSAVQHGGNEVF